MAPQTTNTDTTRGTTLLVVGASHRTARLTLRERLFVDETEAARLVRALTATCGEAAVVSTCNRTEIYVAGSDPSLARATVTTALARVADVDEGALAESLFAARDADAARHLFRVAGGLDSLIVGEPQIVAQLRNAFALAQNAGGAGPVLNRLFAHAFHAGRRIRADGGLTDVAASVPAAAAEVARAVIGDLAARRILVIGAGKMGRLAAANLAARGAERVFVANHTMAKAEDLASRFGGTAVPFERVGDELGRADVVVSSTGCPQLLVTKEDVERALPRRAGRPLVFVDIAVPRDVDPAVRDLSGCALFDVDDLAQHAGASGVNRARLDRAEAAASDAAEEFEAWRRSLAVAPAIASLRRRAEEIRAGELARNAPRLRSLSDPERRAIDALTSQIIAKLLHEPTVRLRESAAGGDGADDAAALERLFALADDA